MSNPENVERAFFTVDGDSKKIPVHFNPQTWQYTITNNLKNTGKGDAKKQYVSESTGKLTLDLIFDTTGTGEDVRITTIKVSKFMEPDKKDKAPPIINFEWGLYTFKGMMESYKETIDYFSANGVPLRASVNLTMSSQDKVFEGGSSAKKAATSGPSGLPNDSATVTDNTPANVATQGGNPSAAKDIAASNGLESMRFSAGVSLEIAANTSLKGPSAFTTTGIDLASGAGIDLGVSTEAFSGLRSKVQDSSPAINIENINQMESTAGLSTTAQSSFGVDGSANIQAGAGMTAEVGAAGELKSKIEFDGES